MEPFEIEHGRVIRTEDDQLLRTKIVASIGDPAKYSQGITELDGRVRPPEKITYDYLVSRFYDNGVDVIRINLSHPNLGELRPMFLKIKAAIIKREGSDNARKRLAVLVDLPGPKIRFHLAKGMRFRLDQVLKIHFLKSVQKRNEVTVFVNDKPLGEALQGSDRLRATSTMGTDDPKKHKIIENVIGRGSNTTRINRDSYAKFVARIRERVSSPSGLRVVLGDGEVLLKVEQGSVNEVEGSIKCAVVAVKGTSFKEKPGFTLKDVDLDISSFTNEDREKLGAVIELDYASAEQEPVLAFVGLSFAQSADDVLRARRFLEEKLDEVCGGRLNPRLRAPSIIAKIETKKGMDNRRYILDVADGIMVARGDLGLQMNLEEVPVSQKKLIRLCNKRGKPVVTATEMLKSMTESMEPTRAEITDVFNAIMDGSDAVMMSGETSTGKFPLHSIRKMIAIAVNAERYHEYRGVGDDDLRRSKCLDRIEEFLKDDDARIKRNDERFDNSVSVIEREMAGYKGAKSDVIVSVIKALEWRRELYSEKWSKTRMQIGTNLITQAACRMAEGEGIMCILAASTSGRTVRMISRLRPSVMIVGAAHDPMNTRKLALSYGVLPICVGEVRKKEDGPEEVFIACQTLLSSNAELKSLLLNSGAIKMTKTVIFTAGKPLLEPGTTNLIQSRELEIAED